MPTVARPANRIAASSTRACSVCDICLTPAAHVIATGTNMSEERVLVNTRDFHSDQNSAFPHPMTVTNVASKKEERTAATAAAQHTTVAPLTVSRRVG